MMNVKYLLAPVLVLVFVVIVLIFLAFGKNDSIISVDISPAQKSVDNISAMPAGASPSSNISAKNDPAPHSDNIYYVPVQGWQQPKRHAEESAQLQKINAMGDRPASLSDKHVSSQPRRNVINNREGSVAYEPIAENSLVEAPVMQTSLPKRN